MPAGFRFLGPGTHVQRSPDAPIIMREAVFYSSKDRMVVVIWVSDQKTTDVCGVNKGAAKISRKLGAHKVLIQFNEPTVADGVASAWESVPLTADLESVDWLRG